MTDFALEDYLREGKLVQVLNDWITDPIPIHVVYPQNRHLSAKVRVFVEWVAELLAAHPGMRIRAAAIPGAASQIPANPTLSNPTLSAPTNAQAA